MQCDDLWMEYSQICQLTMSSTLRRLVISMLSRAAFYIQHWVVWQTLNRNQCWLEWLGCSLRRQKWGGGLFRPDHKHIAWSSLICSFHQQLSYRSISSMYTFCRVSSILPTFIRWYWQSKLINFYFDVLNACLWCETWNLWCFPLG